MGSILCVPVPFPPDHLTQGLHYASSSSKLDEDVSPSHVLSHPVGSTKCKKVKISSRIVALRLVIWAQTLERTLRGLFQSCRGLSVGVCAPVAYILL